MQYSPAPMHIPDGFLSVLVAIVLWLLTAGIVGYALKRVGADLGERQVPLMGVWAAAIFAGQMLNFTVIGGTSGHLMGAAIATILLGPWAAMLVITCVVAIQALIFQDGGLLVLGANIFNMGIVGVAVSHMAYRTVQKIAGGRTWGIYVGGFTAAWLSIEVAALGVALQLALSNPSITRLAIPAMAGVHALIGVSFRIEPCEKVALVGPNGAGKSTLILHLNGILTGTGRVCVASLEVNKQNLGRVRAQVGLVFQQPDDQLFSPTVYDDVAFGPLYQGLPHHEIQQRVSEALAAVHMSAYARRVSHHLSVGEKKRIAIATVLSMRPEVLMLDEPTAGLDPRARRSLIRLLDELPITMLVSTHDMLLVRELFPRMIIMDEGRVVADGPTMDLMNDAALLEAHGLEKP